MSESEKAPAEARSVTSVVEVAVEPRTAFEAFTDELDLWWVRGPINHHAGGRVLAMRCEPGVGGRLLEVYDDNTGEALELAKITTWEPGRRLAWLHRRRGDRGLLRCVPRRHNRAGSRSNPS
jgi:uncharacterized protein YndB with AHSA1/START domain